MGMNLLVDSLADYLTTEWDQAVKNADGTRTALFIVQSLPPQLVSQLFHKLDEHRLHWLNRGKTLDCHFRVATGLWRAWQQNATHDNLALLEHMRKQDWIDTEDRLTWYRNLTRAADRDGLVAVLVGLDHATDQGGLADFHRVDEARLWQSAMKQSFSGWLERLSRHDALEATEDEIARFDETLKALFKIKPRQLTHLAAYIGQLGQGCYSFAEWVERFYWELPFWGIPPLRLQGRELSGKNSKSYLKEADDFINHQRLKTASEQKKAWKKLTEALNSGGLALPEPIDPENRVYQDVGDYQRDLQDFIHKADAEAKKRLLQADLLPVLKILKGREKPGSKKETAIKLSGMSMAVMLQAIWRTLEECQKKRPAVPLLTALCEVRIVLTGFKHDLADDEELGMDGKALAKAMLKACLGGLDQWLEQIHLCLPVDEAQASQPREQWEKPVPIRLDLGLIESSSDMDTPEDKRIGVSRKNPHVTFNVELWYAGEDGLAWEEDEENDDDEAVQGNIQGNRQKPGKPSFRSGMSESIVHGWQTPSTGADVRHPCHLDSGSPCRNDGESSGLRRFQQQFRWEFGPSQAERVRYQCANAVKQEWNDTQPGAWMLPGFKISSDYLTALYFAADAEEANRLVGLALSEFELFNWLDKLGKDGLQAELREKVETLAGRYSIWLQYSLNQGYFAADTGYYLSLSKAYTELAEAVLNPQHLGGDQLLRRFYKAFLLVDDKPKPNDDYLRSAVAWGLSLPVMELEHHRLVFLRDSFAEVVGEWLLSGGNRGGKNRTFDKLLQQAELHRPLAGLIVDAKQNLSAKVKPFGLIHCLGECPSLERSLAVQTLLREEEIDDDEEVAELVADGEESEIVIQVLRDYQRFYPFAQDGLRILALYMTDLATVLAGVHRFLHGYLKPDKNDDWPVFECHVMVYSTSASPMVMEKSLTVWRDALMDKFREHGRGLLLTVGHRYAPDRDKMSEWLKQEARLYDVAFLFHFLEGEMTGVVEEALPFEYEWSKTPFPICEYPRPIRKGYSLRQCLLSNRDLRLQTRHADLSARLRQPQNTQQNHLLYGRVDAEPWRAVINALHGKAQWVACIDPFVDKFMLCTDEPLDQRGIVGFASGLGDYGELNLTLSTEQDTLGGLVRRVKTQLQELLPYLPPDGMEELRAVRVVGESESIIGLSSLHAMVGEGEQIREVIGFAAIKRALPKPQGDLLTQLLPLDAMLHWFANGEDKRRPDLLQLVLRVGADGLPALEATLIECKLAQSNAVPLLNAIEQVTEGFRHLVPLFAPHGSPLPRLSFDRRYWWAQLQRAITSRSIVDLPPEGQRKLDRALEYLTDGYYDITWRGLIFTFWTDQPLATPDIRPVSVPSLQAELQSSEGVVLWHYALGYQGWADLLAQNPPLAWADWQNQPGVMLKAKLDRSDEGADVAAAVDVSIPQAETEEVAKIVGRQPLAAESPAIGSRHGDADLPLNSTESRHGSVGRQPLAAESPAIGSRHGDADLPLNSTESRHGSVGRQTLAVESPAIGSRHGDADLPLNSTESRHGSAPVPERLLIGTRSNGEPVYWHYGHKELSNRHLLIFGASGSGKTYGIQCLLAEMAVQGLNSLIVDYTDGFLPTQTEEKFRGIANPQSHFIFKEPLPINPFRKQSRVIDPSEPAIEESPYQVATRVASIFSSIFDTLGEQQSALLIRVMEAGIQAGGFGLDDLPGRLREEGNHGETLANKLEPLIRARPFCVADASAWGGMLGSPGRWVHVLQLTGLAHDIQKLVTEFALWDLYDYACSRGDKNRPIPIVLDEIQNLDHRKDSPLDKMLREGRKFGLSLILATQTASQFNQEQKDRLFQAGHKLFFKPAGTEIGRFADLLSQKGTVSKSDWAQRLGNLQKGQCWSLGQVQTSSGELREEAVLVSVTALEKRLLQV